MSSRRTKSSRSLPGQPGPFSGPYNYYPDPLSAEDQRLLELHERAMATEGLAAAVAEEGRREELRERRRRAREAGRRAGTVSGRWYGTGAEPFLRLSGRWLRAAGFPLGQGFEVEVRRGRLVIRATGSPVPGG